MYSSVVTHSIALKIVSLTSSFVSSGSSESELTQVAEVLSNSISFAQYSEAGLPIIQPIKEGIDSIVRISLERNSSFTLSSSKISVQVQTIELGSPASTLSLNSELSLTLPASLGVLNGSRALLSAVVIKDSLYQSIAPSGTIQATDTLSLNLYIDGVKHKISGLS